MASRLRGKRGLRSGFGGIATKPFPFLPDLDTRQDIGSPLQGEGGLTVPGFIGAIGSDCSPIPSRGELLPTKTITQIPLDDPAKVYLKFLRQSYLEHEATSPSTLKTQIENPTGRMCGTLALLGQDEDENRIAKRIACGREWCQDCRQITHKRRIARILPRLMQVYPMAYDVITFSLEVRPLLHNPRVLSLLARKVRRLYRSLGYQKVYTRWHFFGDKSNIYNPHLNVLCDGRWLSKVELAQFKDAIRRALLPRSISNCIGKDLVIHHQYTRNPKKMMNWVRYVTRATFTERQWDEPLAQALYGFHNGCFAGTWNDPTKWRLTGTDKKYTPLINLAQNLHPVSGKPLTWSRKPIPWALVLMEEPTDIGAWWYLLPPIRDPPVHCRSPSPSTSNTQTRCP
ncbi:hypothetical protein ES705_33165 [subsurface metagenome]